MYLLVHQMFCHQSDKQTQKHKQNIIACLCCLAVGKKNRSKSLRSIKCFQETFSFQDYVLVLNCQLGMECSVLTTIFQLMTPSWCHCLCLVEWYDTFLYFIAFSPFIVCFYFIILLLSLFANSVPLKGQQILNCVAESHSGEKWTVGCLQAISQKDE